MWFDEKGSATRGPAAYERPLWIVFIVAAVTVVASAVYLMLRMDAGSKGQGGRFYVALFATILVGVVSSPIEKILHRLVPFDLATTPPERRFAAIALATCVLSALVLFGAAFLLP